MFEGDGIGVGLTINQLRALVGAELVPADAGWHPTRLGELMPVAARDDAGLGEEMRRASIPDSPPKPGNGPGRSGTSLTTAAAQRATVNSSPPIPRGQGRRGAFP